VLPSRPHPRRGLSARSAIACIGNEILQVDLVLK
jgi:hypothetical protein